MTDKSDPRSQFLFGKAFAAFDAVVHQVPDDAWGNASPCEEWTAADIVGHVAATTQLPCFLAQRVPIGVPAGPDASERPTRGGDNLFFSKAVMETLIGLREESVAGNALEVWDRSYAHMNDVLSGDVWGQPPIASQRGTMTLEEWLEPVFYDSTVHAWDLSQATGVPHNLDDDLCRAALATLISINESADMRSAGVFLQAKDTQSDDPVDQLIAYTGRTAIR